VNATRPSRFRALVWIVLCSATVAPFVVAALPPLYDYYHWVFEGDLFASLAFGQDTARDRAIAGAYGIRALPVPNSAATVVLGLLDLALPPLVAGRVFAASCALAFALGFACLARAIQRRPTVVELLGFPWAFGYFFYKGYLSYVFSVALAFFALGALMRTTDGGRRPPGGRVVVGMGIVSVLLFASHLVGWALLLGGAAFLALGLWPTSRRDAVRLVAPFAPSLVLPVWYALGSRGGKASVYYGSWGDKLRSLLEPWFLYVRTDPIPPAFPTPALTLAGITILAALLLAGRGENPERRSVRALVRLSAVLAALALALPFNNFMGMNRPDGRILFPALLIATATIPYRRLTGRGAFLAGGVIVAGLALHSFEYARASRYLERVASALEESVPRDEPGLSVAVILPGPESGCGRAGSLHLGRSDTLRWFGLVPVLEADQVRVSLMATSLVEKYFDHEDPHDLKLVALESGRIPDLVLASRGWADRVAHAEIFGCPGDVERAASALALYFEKVASGPGFAVLETVD